MTRQVAPREKVILPAKDYWGRLNASADAVLRVAHRMRQNGKIQPQDHLLLERLWLRDHLLPSLSVEDHEALRENGQYAKWEEAAATA
jgi:hypothetical protein